MAARIILAVLFSRRDPCMAYRINRKQNDEGLMLGDGYFDICSAHTDEEINEHYYMYQGRSWDQASVLYINPVKEGYINIIV